MHYQLSDFDYELPAHLIASEPTPERSSSRLMVLETPEIVAHRIFKDIEILISSNDLLVFNDTRVMKARLYGQKPTGGRVELLVESVSDQPHLAWAHIKASHAPQAGSSFEVAGQQVQVLERRDSLGLVALDENSSWYDLMDQSGALPLPPYMHKEPNEQDEVRYQTVYAKQLGAVAAPTAGLHFDDKLLQTLRDKNVPMAFVTLHVGAGTFAPVKTENLNEHHMHSEWARVDQSVIDAIVACRARGGRVVAVGTTALRALESMAMHSGSSLQSFTGHTDLFIQPGFEFKVVDVLITNFHLPKSTLLMLVSALAGYDRIRHLYQIAINNDYRFFSYGDAMWLPKLS